MKTLFTTFILCSFCIISFSQCAKDTGIETYQPSPEEIESLKYLREEEFLAGDVYEYFSNMYDIPVFRNISKSEDVHTERVRMLIDRYQIEDPAANHTTGNFKNNELQDLYNSLIEKGSYSLDSAIVVGLMIEEKDILDLQDALDNTIKAEDIRAVYIALKRGSNNHLRAFYRHAEAREIGYSPRFLDETTFMEYLAD
jgi:hypothetical protein